jgi:hypothetical protein
LNCSMAASASSGVSYRTVPYPRLNIKSKGAFRSAHMQLTPAPTPCRKRQDSLPKQQARIATADCDLYSCPAVQLPCTHQPADASQLMHPPS